jgi:hypothetical protein
VGINVESDGVKERTVKVYGKKDEDMGMKKQKQKK